MKYVIALSLIAISIFTTAQSFCPLHEMYMEEIQNDPLFEQHQAEFAEELLYRSLQFDLDETVESISWMKVNPNSASDDVQIELELRDLPLNKCHLLITDVSGKTIKEFDVKYAQQQFAIDIRKWTAGSYLAMLSFDGKSLSSLNFNVVH